MPFIHVQLQPPATILHSAMAHALHASSDEGAEHFKRELAALGRIPKYQVIRFQVFELKRSKFDPPNGSVLVIVRGGIGSFGVWDDADEVITAWKNLAKPAL